MNIREAKLTDLPKLLEFEQCVIEAELPYNSSIKEEATVYYDLNHLILSNDTYLLVVEEEGDLIGTGYVQIRESKPYLKHDLHAYLGFMYVVPNHRGKGINAKLISLLIDWSKLKGVKDFYLDVYAKNASAIKAYEKVGFKQSMFEMKLNTNENNWNSRN